MADKLIKFSPGRYAVIGILAGLFSYFLSWAIVYFRVPTFFYQGKLVSVTASTINIDLRAQVLQLGYFKELGLRIVDMLQGSLGFNPLNLVGVVFGFMAVVFVGRIFYGIIIKKENKFFRQTRVAWSFFFGGTFWGLLIPFIFGLPVSIIISIIIYSFLLGWIMQGLVAIKKFKWIVE